MLKNKKGGQAMGAIQNSIQLIDNVTPILRNITNSLHTVISNVQVVDNANMDPNFTGINQNLIHAENEISKMQEQIKKINKTQISPKSNFSAVTQNIGNAESKISKMQEKLNNVNKTTISPLVNISPAISGYEKISNSVSHVTEKIKNVTNSQHQFNSAVDGCIGVMGNLQSKVIRIGSAIVAYLGVSKVLALSDAYSQTTARLNLMNDNLQTTAELQNKIFASAQRARSEYQATADFISKVGMQAKDAFKSNDEVILMAEQINKVFKISGTAQQEQASAMLQLTQALGSGVLRGEELNAVFEAAPMLIRNIADYLNVSMGEIRDMASEGQLTSDIVKKAIFASVDEVNRKFESIPKTWSDLRTSIENEANKAFWPVLNQINQIANSKGLKEFTAATVSSMPIIGAVIAATINEFMYLGDVLYASWNRITETILWGINSTISVIMFFWNITETVFPYAIGILGIYAACWLAVESRMLTNAAITSLVTAKTWIMTTATSAWIAVTGALTTAQTFLNLVLLANPIGIVIALVIAAVAIFTAWQIKTNGLANTMASVFGFIVDVVEGSVNAIVSILNIAIDSFNAVGSFIGKLMGFEYSTIGKITYKADYSDIKSTGQDFIQNANLDSVGNFIKEKIDVFMPPASAPVNSYGNGLNFALDPASAGNLADTAKNTGKLKDSLDITEEDLKYLRDVAEQEIINRFTTAEVNVHMVNNNNINSDLDLDGIYNGLGEKIIEEVDISAEGEHK